MKSVQAPPPSLSEFQRPNREQKRLIQAQQDLNDRYDTLNASFKDAVRKHTKINTDFANRTATLVASSLQSAKNLED